MCSAPPEAPCSGPREQDETKLDGVGSPWPLSGSHAQPEKQPLGSWHFRSPCANHFRVTPVAKHPEHLQSCGKDQARLGSPPAWHSPAVIRPSEETQPCLYPEPSARVAGASDHQRLTRRQGDGERRSALPKQLLDTARWTPCLIKRQGRSLLVVTSTHLGPHGLCPKSCPTTSPVALGKCLSLLCLFARL